MEGPFPHPEVCSLMFLGLLADGQAVTASLCVADMGTGSALLTPQSVLRPEQALKRVGILQFVCQSLAWDVSREKLG